jgi:hypothetical protein
MLQRLDFRQALWIVPALIAGAAAPGLPRGFQVIALAAMIGALGGAGRRLAWLLVPETDRASRWLADFCVAVGLATGLTFWLGHLGGLRPAAFLLSVAGLYLTCLWIPAGRREKNELPPEPPQSRFERVLEAASVALLGIVTVRFLYQNRNLVPGFFGFDDLSYHLAAVATWFQYGDLRMLKFSFGDPSTTFYPIVAELFSWVLIAPFQNSDVLARWSQLPFAIFSGVALLAICRRLGMPRRTGVLAAVSFLSIRRVLPVLAFTAGNDHTASFFVLAGVDAMLRLGRRPRPGAAVYAGLVLGLLAGTKYIGILYVALLILVLAVSSFAHRASWGEDERSFRAVLRNALILVGIALLAGGYTYLRNAWTTGNPLFPSPVHIAGIEVFEGWESTSLAERLLQPEAAINIPRFLLDRRDLFGPAFPYTLLPAALLAPLAALAWRRRIGSRSKPGGWIDTVLVASLPVAFFLLFLYGTHDHRDMRYFMPGVALAALLFAWLLELPGPRTGTVLRCLAFLVPMHHLARRFRVEVWQEVLGVAALLALTALWLWLRDRGAGRRFRWGIAGLVLLALAAGPVGKSVEKYQKRKLRGEPIAARLEQLSGGRGVEVAYLGWNQPYLFYGSRLQNRVEMVPYDWDLDSRFFDWGASPELPFNHRLPRRWVRQVDGLGIDYVVVTRAGFENPERRWIEERPWKFRQVYGDGIREIWQVFPPGSRGKIGPDDQPGKRPGARPPRRRRPAGSRAHPHRHQRLHAVAPDAAGGAGDAGDQARGQRGRGEPPALSGARPPAGAAGGGPARPRRPHRARGGAARRDLAAAPAPPPPGAR